MSDLGVMSSETWELDPRRLGFVLARYKFVAKMFRGFASVLELGCADAFGTRVVCQEVGNLTVVDINEDHLFSARRCMSERWSYSSFQCDMVAGPMPMTFHGAYALDVLEHIEPANEQRFVGNI